MVYLILFLAAFYLGAWLGRDYTLWQIEKEKGKSSIKYDL